MLGKFASDALGLSDIGKIISPKDYNKVDSDDYIFHEDNEKIYFLIKSKSDEYCFTNKGLIHVDGATAVSKKRNLYRYEYYLNRIAAVSLETAGNIDLDVEIKFAIGPKSFSIDVDKKQLEQLKDLYKALIRISEYQRENDMFLTKGNESIESALQAISTTKVADVSLSKEFKEINEYIFNWSVNNIKAHVVKDYGYVFEKYINN
ncbi:MAG: PH domain-containing protein [Sarcina sp.]